MLHRPALFPKDSKHLKQSIRLITDLNAWYYCYQTCSVQIPVAAVTGIKGIPLMGIGSSRGTGSHSWLCACRTHASTLSLPFSLCIYTCKLDFSPFWSWARGFPAASLQFSSCQSYHSLGTLPSTSEVLSSPANLLQQTETTCPLPCLYVSLAGIQPRLPGLLNTHTWLSIIWDYSRLLLNL